MAPRVHHFIVRPEVVKRLPTGLAVEQSLVPLIPLDELPEWLDIIGVPRSLTPEQTSGLSNLGCYERQGVHDVEIIIGEAEFDSGADDEPRSTSPVEEGGKPVVGDNKAQSGLQHSRWSDRVNDKGAPGKPESPTGPVTAAAHTASSMHPAERMMAHVSPPSATISTPRPVAAAASANPHQPSSASPPDTTSPNPTKPVRSRPPTPGPPETKKRANCRHWIHHGTCKWGPYCRFTHTMPATLSGLAEVGLRDFPSWWTAAMGLALSSPPQRKMNYMRMNGVPMGYGYGMPTFMPYGRAGPGGLGGYGGFVGYGRKEREVRKREVHPREIEGRARKMKVEAGVGNGGVVPGMRTVGERDGGQAVGQTHAVTQAPAIARGSVVARGPVVPDRKGPEVLGEQIRQEAQVQRVRPQQAQQQQKLVDF